MLTNVLYYVNIVIERRLPMNSTNRKRGWIGVIGMAGVTVLCYANTLNVVAHMASGRGSLSLGIPLAIIFACAAAFFGKLAYDKARYLASH